jgi:quercetin dioxygenase-like cupin family protein
VYVVPIALAAVIAGCSGGGNATSSPQAGAHGATIEKLDAGRVDSLPTGAVYVRFIRFAQPPGYVINSKQHVPSIVYVETGAHQLVLSGQPPVDLTAGQAKFHQTVTHMHLNHGSELCVWYSIAIWPSSARAQPLVDPIARAAFESQDIDRSALPPVGYAEVLRQVTLTNSGTTGAHRFGGLSAFYVLSGSVTIRSTHRSVTLGRGQGVAFLPDVDLQESNAGTDRAIFLEFLITPIGKDFEVPLQRPPAA